MPSLNAKLTLRPTRIGFLVRPTNLKALQSVFQVCSCLWGGIYNPIIPVARAVPRPWKVNGVITSSGRELALAYIRLFEPDVYVESEPQLAAYIGISQDKVHPEFRRVLALDELVSDTYSRDSSLATGLDIFNVYRDLYKTQFRFLSRHEERVVEFETRGRCRAYIDATFGRFPDHKDLSYIKRAYRDVFAPDVLRHEPSAWLQVITKRRRTPLTFTTHGLDNLDHGDYRLTLYLVNPDSPVDLMTLWNLRLLHRNILPINANWMPELGETIRGIVDRNHRPIPGNKYGEMTYANVIAGRSFEQEEAIAMANDLLGGLASTSWRLKDSDDIVANDDWDTPARRRHPIRAYAASQDLDLTVSEGSHSAVVFKPIAPMFASGYSFGTARWVNVLSLADYSDRCALATVFPSTIASKPYFDLRTWGPVLVSKEGLVLPQYYGEHRESLRLPSGTNAIIDWFSRCRIKASASDAGRVAEQVIASVGGLWGASILQDSKTLHLLDKMSKSTRQRHDTVEEYRDRTAHVNEWRSVMAQRQWGNADTWLDRFVEAGALKLGLSVRCPHCSKENWYGLDDLAEVVGCEQCLKQFSFPQGGIDYKNTPWRFRVAGPYSVPNYASGAYATVLALHSLTRGLSFGHSHLTFSTGLDLEFSGRKLEIDFACWYKRGVSADVEEAIFIIGETKSFGKNSFAKSDVDRLKSVGERIPGTCLVFATLKDNVSPEERRHLSRVAKWGRIPDVTGRPRNPVIVLTGTELFADISVRAAWDKAGGQLKSLSGQTDGLQSFADATQQVYLGLEPMSKWLRLRSNRIRGE